MDASANLVVRSHSPLRRTAFIGIGLLLLAFGLYGSYELGRFDAGYDRQAVGQRETEQTVLRERLEAENRELRVKIAEFETTRVGSIRERAEVARTIGELQAQVGRQSQDLAFLRGIVQQNAVAPELRIQQFRIVATTTPGRFQMRLNVVQPIRPEKPVTGAIDLQVEGTGRDGKAASLGLPELSGGERQELPFSFRYFTDLSEPLTIPPGFHPQRVTVTVRSARKGVAPVTQSFIWTVDAS